MGDFFVPKKRKNEVFSVTQMGLFMQPLNFLTKVEEKMKKKNELIVLVVLKERMKKRRAVLKGIFGKNWREILEMKMEF